MSSIGARVKIIRKSKSLTQQKFADALGLKQNTVATYEMGRAVPSDRTISDICREFGVDRVWLETGVGEPFKPVDRDEQIATILGAAIHGSNSARDRLIRAFCQLPDEMYEQAERILDEVIANLGNERG